MKEVIQVFLLFGFLFLSSSSVEAVTMMPNQALQSSEMTLKPTKLNFVDRLIFKFFQKKSSQKVAFEKAASNNDSLKRDKRWSLSSCVLGVLGLVAFIIAIKGHWSLILLSLLMGIASFVMGVMGLKNENRKVMAIIGLISSSLILIGGLIVGFAIYRYANG